MNLKQLTEKHSGIQYPGELTKPMVAFNESTGSPPRRIDVQPFAEEYVLEAVLQVTYVCNPAQHMQAREDAEKRLCHMLHEDYIVKLMLLKDKIRSGNSNLCLSAIDNIISEMRGEK